MTSARLRPPGSAGSPTRSARSWLTPDCELSRPDTTEKGRPLWKTTMPFTCHPPSTWRRAAGQPPSAGVGELRPTIGREQAEVVRQPLVERELERVVERVAVRDESLDRSKARRMDPTRLEGARTGPRRVQLSRQEEMASLAAHVGGAGHIAVPELALHVQVPLLDQRVAEIGVEGGQGQRLDEGVGARRGSLGSHEGERVTGA